MSITKKNIFHMSHSLMGEGEKIEHIFTKASCRCEKIISVRHKSDDETWYDQEEDEWTILLQGSACLTFCGPDESLLLKPGEYIFIPAHRKHRVQWTDPQIETIWLCFFMKKDQ